MTYGNPERTGKTISFPTRRFTDTPEGITAALKAAAHLLKDDETLVYRDSGTFTVQPGRTLNIVQAVRDGATYRQVGAKYNISGERVRQIVKPHLTAADMTRRSATIQDQRKDAAAAAVRRYAQQNPEASIPEIARNTGRCMTLEQVIETLGPEESMRHPMRATRNKAKVFTDEACLAAIRAAATDENGVRQPLSAKRYEERTTGGPSALTLMNRWGSWRHATAAAGVKSEKASRKEWTRNWNDADLRKFAVQFFRAYGPTGTAAQYTEWSKENDAAPSLATMRNRFGRWSEIRSAVAVDLL